MFCNQCGNQASDDSRFCGTCGAPLERVSKEMARKSPDGDKTTAETQGEQTYVNNLFGQVTDKRVVYFRKKTRFSGGSREDVPLKHITSVRVDTSKNVVGGILLVIIGIFLLWFVVGIIPLVYGILLLWGSPTVVVNTTGGDREGMQGWPWDRQHAEEFVSGLRNQLFKD